MGTHFMKRISVEIADLTHLVFSLSENSPSGDAQYTLCVGNAVRDGPCSFYINGNGWGMRAGTNPSFENHREDDHNIVGPAFAACVGVADAFKVGTGQLPTSRIENVSVSLWNFGSATLLPLLYQFKTI